MSHVKPSRNCRGSSRSVSYSTHFRIRVRKRRLDDLITVPAHPTLYLLWEICRLSSQKKSYANKSDGLECAAENTGRDQEERRRLSMHEPFLHIHPLGRKTQHRELSQIPHVRLSRNGTGFYEAALHLNRFSILMMGQTPTYERGWVDHVEFDPSSAHCTFR